MARKSKQKTKLSFLFFLLLSFILSPCSFLPTVIDGLCIGMAMGRDGGGFSYPRPRLHKPPPPLPSIPVGAKRWLPAPTPAEEGETYVKHRGRNHGAWPEAELSPASKTESKADAGGRRRRSFTAVCGRRRRLGMASLQSVRHVLGEGEPEKDWRRTDTKDRKECGMGHAASGC
ncbi:hypothetical protein E2542_SST12402 [Spatholobus suberectus]|nr:hypothetical protein E2542_SST12402 [Spatholobus suberectus]